MRHLRRDECYRYSREGKSMKLTDRELWLMRQAFNDGVCDDNFDAWLNEGAADGVTVADVIAKNAPEDSAIAAAVADEREACALVCEQSIFPAFTARCFAADIRARANP